MDIPDGYPAIQDRFLDHPYALAGRVIDPVSGNVSWQGKLVHLQRKDLEVLALLASNPSAVIARASFILVVWDGNDLVGDRGVSDKIFSLRRALLDHDESQPIIRTIPRRGYQLSQPAVQPVLPEQPAFAPGNAIVGSPGWRLQRRLSESEVSESWLAQSSELSTAPQVFSFCRSEAHLRRLQRETTLLRYLSESLGERKDFALVRDWQLQEPPYFLARDYCTHGSLSEWASAVGGLAAQSLPQRTTLMFALAAAVASMHEIGVVHGQLSSASMLLDDGDPATGPQLKLSAFDLGALRDHSKLAPMKITAAGLSFVEGTQAPTMGDDIYALGALLLQVAIGDLSAEPCDASLARVPKAEWRKIISACLDTEQKRPSATMVHQQLLGGATQAESQVAESRAAEKPSPVPVRAAALDKFVGPYRLTDKLGEGGMGTVYLAEQREPVQRQVAVKLIKLGMDTSDVLARFEAERQALALMNHVNIAGVYDAGAAQSGRPYFAMEYVPGLEITAHCDERELDFRQRIELFLQVCDGVLHAHQKGIIHRDLKPSNILIKTAQGQAATAKIIDFGVAKSLQRKLGSLTAHTQLGSFVGTRTYSSPEQISGNIVALDTRTDTYSLGVVLYELLAGVTPYDEEVLAAKSPIELSKLISQEEPPPLLKRFVSLDAEVESDIATRRKLTVAQMKQTLSSDLAWIVAKCLERDPNARYASVLELKKDLGRWLDNRPVEARPITWRYRMGKMVRRNWAAVALGSAMTIALLLTTTTAVMGLVRADRALASARVAAEEAEAAADFQVKQLGSLVPASMGLGLRESLIKAVQQSSEERGLDVSATIKAKTTIEDLLVGVDFTDLTLGQLDRYFFQPALATVKKDYATHPQLQARLWQSLSIALRRMGLLSQATAPQKLALAQWRRLFGKQDVRYLDSLTRRGELRLIQGRMDEAEIDLRHSAEQLRAQLSVRDTRTLDALNFLGWMSLYQGKSSQAESFFTEVLAGRRLVLGEDHSATLKTMSVLGNVKFRLGELAAAQALLEQALNVQRRLLGDDHRDTLSSFGWLARVYEAQDKFQLAEDYFQKDMSGHRKLLGSSHQDTQTRMSNFGAFLMNHGQLDKAEKAFDEIRLVAKRTPKIGNSADVEVLWKANLGKVYLDTGRLSQADAILQEAIKLGRANPDNGFRSLSQALRFLATLRQEQGKLEQAAALRGEISESWQRIAGKEEPTTFSSLDDFAHLLQLQGRLPEAEIAQTQALTGLRKVSGANDIRTLWAETHYAALLKLQGKRNESTAQYRKTLSVLRSVEVPGKIATLECMRAFSQLLREQGELPEALALAREAAEGARSTLDRRDHRVGVFLTEYGKALLASGSLKGSEPILEEAWARLRAVEGVNPAYFRDVIDAFIALYEAWDKAEPGRGFNVKKEFWRKELTAFQAAI